MLSSVYHAYLCLPHYQKHATVHFTGYGSDNQRGKVMRGPEITWAYYPRVAAHPTARAFVQRLQLQGKRPKTLDAYARSIEDLLSYFSMLGPKRLVEADEADLEGYIAHLKRRGPKSRGQAGMIEDHTRILNITGRRLSDNTIALRVVACRLFYEFLIRKRLRTDPINPIARGNAGRNGQRPVRGPAPKKARLPWVPFRCCEKRRKKRSPEGVSVYSTLYFSFCTYLTISKSRWKDNKYFWLSTTSVGGS